MPLIYRHIVPDVPDPDLTAGNGKPCYRDGALSYQRQMEFKVEFGGTFDMAPWLAYRGETASEYRDPTLTAAELNTALAATPHADLASYPCNVNLGYYGDAIVYPGDGELPAGNYALYNYTSFQPTSGYYDFYSGGVLTKSLVACTIFTGLEWDANNTNWRWFSRLEDFTVRFFLDQSGDRARMAYFSMQVGIDLYPFYASSPSTTDIRVGNGLTMPFVQVYSDSPLPNPWRTAALASSELIVSAQAA